MSLSPLRSLAKAYAAGEVDRKSYILERRRLIDGLVTGTEPAVAATAAPAASLAPAAAPELAPLPGEPRRASRWPIAAAVGGLVLLGAAAWYLWSPLATPTPPLAATPDRPESVQLIDKFMRENLWDASHVAGFLDAWRALPPDVQAVAADSVELRRLAGAVHGKIVAEQALQELGERATALASQRRLLDIVKTLGIPGARFSALETAWQAAAAASDPPQPTAAAAGAAEMPPSAASANAVAPAAASDPADAAPEAGETAVAPAASNQPAKVQTAAEMPGDTAEVPPAAPPVVNAPTTPDSATPPAATAQPVATAQTPRQGGCRAELARQRRPYCRDPLADGAAGPALVVIPAGSFRMGDGRAEESPVHEVKLAKPFALGVYEVSSADLQRFCTATGTSCPSQPWGDARYPAVNVPLQLALAYTEWLSSVSGSRYRLPSEAEWEYAARAGTTTATPFGDELLPTHARFSYRHPETSPLYVDDRSVNKNRFRLYHVLGNVREWVRDAWTDNYQDASADGSPTTASGADGVARGGSYADGAERLRSAARAKVPLQGDSTTGLRVLREIDSR